MNVFIEPIGIALLHFLWQGAAAAIVLAILLRVSRVSSANLRYTFGVVTLACMALIPVLTAAYVASTSRSGLAPTSAVERSIRETDGAAGTMLGTVPTQTGRVFDPGSLPVWVVALWLTGVLAFTLIHAKGWRQLRRLRTSAVAVADPRWQIWVDLVRRRLGIRRPVDLLRSARLDVPVLLGWIRPVIVVPTSALTGICPRSLEALLLHELAHVRRHDFLVNSMQAVVETVLFYHPAVWWVSRQVRREREHCCDDLALSLCGSRRRYVQALAEMETLRHAPPTLALAADGGSLVERIRRLTASTAPRETPSRWTVGLAVLAIVAAAAALQIAFSSQAVAEPAPESAPETVTVAMSPAVIANDSDTIEGTWKARSKRDHIWIELRPEGRRSQMSFSLEESEFSGMGDDGISGFDLIRDAGTISFAGSIRDDEHEQRFTFHPNPEYAGRMAAIGFKVSDSPRKLFEMAALDVSYEFSQGVSDAGYGDISSNRLVEFRIHGVDGAFIRGIADAGYEGLEPSRLVEFRIHGVSPEFVRGMSESGFDDLTPGRLVEFRIHGVSPEFVRGMAESGFDDLTAGRLVEFRIHGVSPEFVEGMADSGLEGLTASRLVEFRIHGVSPEFVQQMADSGLEDLSASRLVEFRIHGVSGEFVNEMTDLGIADLTPGNLVSMRIHGVTPEYARKAQAKHGNDLTADELVDMRIHGERVD